MALAAVVCVSWRARLTAAKQARGEHECAHVHGCTRVRPLGRGYKGRPECLSKVCLLFSEFE